jgi:hypothetical protein
MHIILLFCIEKKDYGFNCFLLFFSFFQLTSMTMATSMPPKNFMFCHFFLDESTNKTSLSNQILIHVPSLKPSFKAQLFGFYQRL